MACGQWRQQKVQGVITHMAKQKCNYVINRRANRLIHMKTHVVTSYIYING